MKHFYKIKNYEIWIENMDNFNCTCKGFTHIKVKENPLGMCKHIKLIMSRKRLTPAKKIMLFQFCDWICQECEEKFDKLEVHRIKRGNQGGLYELGNIKIVCKDCHKKYHEKEKMGRK